MIKDILGVLSAIKGGIDLYFYLKQRQRKARLEAAVDDLEKAKSVKEVYDAQSRIRDNQP